PGRSGRGPSARPRVPPLRPPPRGQQLFSFLAVLNALASLNGFTAPPLAALNRRIPASTSLSSGK
ncbi:hypothetical protein, partial [Streptomyces sp. NPDC056689]|uniref:hypothetical protein n=1 Tax=Streptomyces sp. NPDC056689 TaxID=3345911 RepID=UPI003683743B